MTIIGASDLPGSRAPEPTLLLTRHHWTALAERSERPIELPRSLDGERDVVNAEALVR
jgi:hypothetical protein